MSEAIVQVENLSLSYKQLHAVRNVSFSMKPGEILAVIGQNGSGKTSTVECVEGLRKPDSGLIRVLAKIPGRIAEKCIRIWAFNCRRQNISRKSKLRNCADCLPIFTKDPPIGIYY